MPSFAPHFANGDEWSHHTLRDRIEIAKGDVPPGLDLRGGTEKYIFVRSLHFAEDPLAGGKVSDYHTIAKSYYGRITAYSTNGYEPNPADE